MPVPAANDPHDLARFVAAQEGVFDTALAELRRGRKETHWMWFIFPQLAGLGRSPMAAFYAIRSAREAAAYLAHPVLGPRLELCASALLAPAAGTAREIMGSPDDIKLRSSMTLFGQVAGGGSVYGRVLERHFRGIPDAATLDLLGGRAGD